MKTLLKQGFGLLGLYLICMLIAGALVGFIGNLIYYANDNVEFLNIATLAYNIAGVIPAMFLARRWLKISKLNGAYITLALAALIALPQLYQSQRYYNGFASLQISQFIPSLVILLIGALLLYVFNDNPPETITQPGQSQPAIGLEWGIAALILSLVCPFVAAQYYFGLGMLDTWGFVFGSLLGIVPAVIILGSPIAGVVVSVLALRKYKQPGPRQKTGRILSIIGLVLSILTLGAFAYIIYVIFTEPSFGNFL